MLAGISTRKGITEDVWTKLKEELKIGWNAILLLTSFSLSVLIEQTSFSTINAGLKLYVGLSIFLIIQPQRRFSHCSEKAQNILNLCADIFFKIGIYGFGFIFSCVFFADFFTPLLNNSVPEISNLSKTNPVHAVLIKIFSALFLIYLIIKILLKVHFFEFMFNKPYDAFNEYILGRKNQVKENIQLLIFESAVVGFGYYFVSITSATINSLHQVISKAYT